jgi:hypothetical protein
MTAVRAKEVKYAQIKQAFCHNDWAFIRIENEDGPALAVQVIVLYELRRTSRQATFEFLGEDLEGVRYIFTVWCDASVEARVARHLIPPHTEYQRATAPEHLKDNATM